MRNIGDRWDWLVRWMWLGWDMGEDMSMDITMGYGCWEGDEKVVGLDMVGGGVVFWLCVIRLMRLVCGLEKKIGNICKIGVCINLKHIISFYVLKLCIKIT